MIVSRYNFEDAAARSAVLNTAHTGVTHLVKHDPETDTYVVVREDA